MEGAKVGKTTERVREKRDLVADDVEDFEEGQRSHRLWKTLDFIVPDLNGLERREAPDVLTDTDDAVAIEDESLEVLQFVTRTKHIVQLFDLVEAEIEFFERLDPRNALTHRPQTVLRELEDLELGDVSESRGQGLDLIVLQEEFCEADKAREVRRHCFDLVLREMQLLESCATFQRRRKGGQLVLDALEDFEFSETTEAVWKGGEFVATEVE
mmetsp:Transcript_44725/g.74506  ORF Transcript_44725/g.74506 Transcript_44725/m.74506 type:complete len:213 (+) Transcript_44725:83-721(+)